MSVNAGVGKGYGGNIDHLIVKFIISVPINRAFGSARHAAAAPG